MVTITRRVARMNFAPFAAVVFGAAAAILVAAVPVSMFESAVMATGLPQALSIAQPPLGLKARILAIALVFAAVAAFSWLVIAPVERWLDRDRRRRTPWADEGYAGFDESNAPVDAMRRPILATDELGAPLMSDAALETVPPLPDFAVVEADPLLEAPIEDEELRLSSDQETQLVPEPWTPTTPADGETSIHALIRRLEAGLARRGDSDPDPDMPDAAPLALEDDWIVDEAPARQPRSSDDDDFGPALATLKRFAWR